MQPEPRRLDEVLLEPILALGALAMVVLVQSRVPTPAGLWLLDLIIIAAAALSGRYPRAAFGVVVVGLALKLATPASLASAVPLAALINILSAIGRRVRHAIGISVVLSWMIYWLLVIHVEGFPPSMYSTVVTLVLIVLAVAVGLHWRGVSERLSQERALARRRIADLRLELARDLHDTVAQTLSHAAMRAWMAAGEPGVPDGVRHALESIATETSSSAADLRQLLSTLREESSASTTPGPLSDADTLRAEVAAQAERLRAAGFVPDVTVALTTVSAARSTTLAKTVVEGVNNMVKHAPAGSRCVISLVETDDLIVGTFSNPVGPGRRRGRGLGLVGMEERLRLLHGTLEVTVADDSWTTTITLPRT